MHATYILAALSLATAAAVGTSQNKIVSPLVAATTEGSSANAFPWASAVVRRYQQAHGDIGGSAKMITKLAFRPGAPTAATTYTGTATIDMELLMVDTNPLNQMSFVFAQNYAGTPVMVIARKIVNMGPQGLVSPPGPAPFAAMDLILDAPYPYTGVKPLLWEAVVYANTLAGTFASPDADSVVFTNGVSAITGTGCIATGRTVAMTHTATFADAYGTLLINFTVTNGPSSSAALLAIGLTNPNLTVPGLCSNVYTDVVTLLSLGATDAAGAITTGVPTGRTFILPNALAGAVITTQVHCLDAGLPTIPVANSNGRSVTVPTSNLTKKADVMRLTNNAGGTTATEGVFFGTSNLGYGLVTEFTY